MFLTSDDNCPLEEISISDKTVIGLGLIKTGCLIFPSTSLDCRTITFPTSRVKLTGNIPP